MMWIKLGAGERCWLTAAATEVNAYIYLSLYLHQVIFAKPESGPAPSTFDRFVHI